MTEQQQYQVVSVIHGAELRKYARCTVADVVMSGTAERVGNKAFGPLVRYISSKQLSMTAPVLQAASSVSPDTTDSQSWVVSFVLPGGKGVGDYPVPDDVKIALREIPEHLTLAAQWSGRWTYSSVERQTEKLLAVINASGSGLTALGPPVWARYDPPWKPWFLRRNEVLIDVRTNSLS